MCGRFVRTSPQEIIARELGVTIFVAGDLPPRYNIAPGQDVAAIIRDSDETRLGMLRWGLVPPWAVNPASGARAINARAETVSVRPAFRRAFRKRRCLVVADGFYEWRREGSAKIPHFIRLRSGRPFTFAGLWERWAPPAGEPLLTCTILTCPPNELMSALHDRMPVILPAAERDLWLDPAREDPVQLLPLLQPYPAAELEAYPVSRLVNSPRNDSPECVQPLLPA